MKTTISVLIAWLVGVLMGGGAVIGGLAVGKVAVPEKPEQKDSKTAPDVTNTVALAVAIKELDGDYRANAAAAEKKYHGRRLKLTGIVKGINAQEDKASVELVDEGGRPIIYCEFSGLDGVAELRKGERITVIGRCKSHIMFNTGRLSQINLDDCRLVK